MSNSGFAQFIPLILIFVIFYFFLIRPQQKKIKQHKAMVNELKRGDNVVTSGGIVGKVEKILEGDKVSVSISDDVIVKVVKSTIQSVITDPDTKK
jgi:preprotein translocase subunit YajC